MPLVFKKSFRDRVDNIAVLVEIRHHHRLIILEYQMYHKYLQRVRTLLRFQVTLLT